MHLHIYPAREDAEQIPVRPSVHIRQEQFCATSTLCKGNTLRTRFREISKAHHIMSAQLQNFEGSAYYFKLRLPYYHERYTYYLEHSTYYLERSATYGLDGSTYRLERSTYNLESDRHIYWSVRFII